MIRNVILIVIDCLRADHVSCYGYDRETTPTIDKLARHGRRWSQAYATTSWTKPSIASVLTGLYPSEHLVLKGPKRTRGRSAATTDALRGDLPHIAETLSGHGVRCVAFLNNVQLAHYSGFDRGFHTYEPICGKADWQLAGIDEWLGRHGKEPFFIYSHLMEAHWPYRPRRRHVEMFGGDRDKSRFVDFSALDFAKLRRALTKDEVTLSPTDLADMVRMYDAAVRRLDGKIKTLQRLLEHHRVADTTALVITADHGEEFCEHGTLGHGHSLYVEATRVPLILWRPDSLVPSQLNRPVSLVDLPKTLLSLVGCAAPFPGHDLIECNVSCSPAYSELSVGGSFLRAMQNDRWRLHRLAKGIRSQEHRSDDVVERLRNREFESEESVQLFDVGADPREQTDLAGGSSNSPTIDRLTNEMHEVCANRAEWIHGSAQFQTQVDDTVVERLRSLGYID